VSELIAQIACLKCQAVLGEVSSDRVEDLAALTASLAVACHAAQPHTNHALSLTTPTREHAIERELSIRCLAPGCKESPPLVTTCPIELVAAITIVFHAAHEGHSLELRYGDRMWSSPPRHA
jgi:hypothetical protein